MIPVSSTVIPLPVYKMEYGFGFVSKNKKAQSSSKPEDGVKLITSKLNIYKIIYIYIFVHIWLMKKTINIICYSQEESRQKNINP